MPQLLQRLLAPVAGALVGGSTNGPWRSRSVLAATAAVFLGLGLWFSEGWKARETAPEGVPVRASFAGPVPGYVRVCASYVGGFVAGWLFRRFLRVAAVLSALALGGVALAARAGCDTRRAEREIHQAEAWVEREAGDAHRRFTGLLPSAAATGFGAWRGFRRREPVVPPPAV
ncbi:MAG: hypothetical protein ACKVYV_00970 [Limisphaerales bacterium]